MRIAMGMFRIWKRRAHPGWGIVAGMAGGLMGSWMMNAFLTGAANAEAALQTPEERAKAAEQPAQDDSTMKVADALAQVVTHRPLTHEQKEIGGPLVHYGFGALMGGVYGATAEYWAGSKWGFGSAFGAALFLAADEVMVPAVGLSGPPTEQPLGGQAKYLTAHMVFGVTTEAVRWGIRRLV